VLAHGLGSLAAAVAKKPGREHPCIVHHQQVIRPQQCGEFAKTSILPAPELPGHMQQARPGAIRQRLLRNAFRRQIVVKLGDEHR